MRPPDRIRRSAAILFSLLKSSSDKSGSNIRSSRFTIANSQPTASRYSLREVISVRWGSGGVSISAMPLSDQQPPMKIPAVTQAEKHQPIAQPDARGAAQTARHQKLGLDIRACSRAKRLG